MKLYINRSQISGPWGGGAHFINAFHHFVPELGHELVSSQSMTGVPAAVLLAGLDADNDGGISAEQAVMYKLYNPNVKLVLRVNENDARKGTRHVDNYLLKIASHMDVTVFVSEWLRDYFMEKGWPCSTNTVIVNGVRKDVFGPQPKLNNGKLNIVAHHWSNNELKGFDVYDKIDALVGKHPDRLAFTYIGRDRQTFKHTNVVRPLSGKRLGEELGKHDVYVSASRFDPGPNHIIEAIACELPTYVHADGGGCVEFAGQDHVYQDWPELERLLLSGDVSPNSTQFTEWKACIEEYIRLLETSCQENNP